MFKNRIKYIEYLTIFFIGLIISTVIILKIDLITGSIGKFFSILKPFYIGFAIAYILNRPINFLEGKTKIKRGYLILSSYIVVLGLITIFVSYFMPSVIDSSVKLITALSKGIENIPNYIANMESVSNSPIKSTLESNLSKITELLGYVTNFLVDNVAKAMISITSTLMNLIFGIIISIYMLIDKLKIRNLFKNIIKILFSEKRANGIIDFMSEVNVIFSHFITGLIVEAMTVGTLAFIGMTILNVRYAPILAMIICFTNVIPYIGPFIGAVPAVVATFLYDPKLALIVMIYILILQQFDGNFLGPKIMGNYIGLDPIWIILSITIGGGFLGMLGILLAIPIGAIAKIVLTRLLNRYERKKAVAD